MCFFLKPETKNTKSMAKHDVTNDVVYDTFVIYVYNDYVLCVR